MFPLHLNVGHSGWYFQTIYVYSWTKPTGCIPQRKLHKLLINITLNSLLLQLTLCYDLIWLLFQRLSFQLNAAWDPHPPRDLQLNILITQLQTFQHGCNNVLQVDCYCSNVRNGIWFLSDYSVYFILTAVVEANRNFRQTSQNLDCFLYA